LRRSRWCGHMEFMFGIVTNPPEMGVIHFACCGELSHHMPMKILQLPTEIAGQANLTARGLREIGLESRNAAKQNAFGYPRDMTACFPIFDRVRNPFLFFFWVEQFDVFHYHKSPFWTGGLDVAYLRARERKYIVEFWGSDIRLLDIERARNPYFAGDNSFNDRKKLKRLNFWARQTDQVIMSDNSADVFLEPYFDKIHIVRQRIDTQLYKPVYPDVENKKPVIVHAPSVAGVKGTEFVERAIESLRAKGLDFEYVRLQGVPHEKAIEIYSRADIIVDQLLIGSHGVFACEAMALGKPVICYILDTLLDTYPEGFPIVNANPDSITGVLEELVVSPQKRAAIGRASREYVERVHDIRQVARRLQKVYEAL